MKIEIILGRIFIALLAAALTFLALDYVSISLLPTRAPLEQRYPVEIFRRPQPYTMFGGTPLTEFEVKNDQEESHTEKLNRLGYRGPEPALPKPDGEYRIIVLGGSTVFLGNPPIPALLAEEFRRGGQPQVKVYNFGVISSASSMEVTRLVFEVSKLEPDLVMMYNGANDIFGPYRNDPRPGFPFNFLVYENNPLLESNVKSYPAWTLLAYGSNIARHLFPNYFLEKFSTFDRVRQETDWGSDKWRGEIAQIYVDNLVRADKISRAFGADFIAFPQPMIYFKDNPAPEEADLAGNEERRQHCDEVRRQMRAAIVESKTAVKVVDLSDIYDNTSDWIFTDVMHTRQVGMPVVAQAMRQSIMDYFGEKIKTIKPH